MIEKKSDVTSSLPGYYYSKLVDIWIHQDKTFWTSISTFLVVESILFVALFQALDVVETIRFLPAGLSLVGFFVSLLWLLVSSRWRRGILLLENQLRHMEMELFHSRIVDSNQAQNFFPMYFSGSRAVMFKGSETEFKDHEKQMRDYYEKMTGGDGQALSLEKLLRAMESGLSGWSSNRIVTYVLPLVFMLAWSIGLTAALSHINGVWLIALPGVVLILLAASVAYVKARNWNPQKN